MPIVIAALALPGIAAARTATDPVRNDSGFATRGLAFTGGFHTATAIIEVPDQRRPAARPDTKRKSDLADAEAEPIRKLLAEGKHAKALEEVAALERKRPKSADVLVLKSEIQLAMNDAAAARASLEQALANQPDSTSAALELAQLDLRERKTDAARKRFEAILAGDAKNIEAMAGMAGVAAVLGREADYVSWLQKAIAASPVSMWPRYMLVDYYVAKKDTRKAVALAQEAYKAYPEDPKALELLGTAQLAAGESEAAVRSFTRLVAMTPNLPSAHVRLAAAQAATKNFNAARTSANRALELKPDSIDAQVQLVAIEAGSRQYDKALKAAKAIQTQHPGSATGYSIEGDVLVAQRQFDAAAAAYQKAFDIHKSGFIAIKLHQALSGAGKHQDAEARLVQWLKEQPNDVVVRSYLAEAYLRSGKFAPAIDQLEQVVKANPRDAQALNNLAWVYQQQRDPRALATARRAYELNRDDPETLDTLGWILVSQGESREGLELIDKAIRLAPRAPTFQYHRAAALAKAGDKVRARRELERLLASYPAFSQRADAEALLKQL